MFRLFIKHDYSISISYILLEIPQIIGNVNKYNFFFFLLMNFVRYIFVIKNEKPVLKVALRWVYEQEVSIVTKSFNKERMRQNIDIFDWSLSEEELANINQLPQHRAIVFANIFGQHDLVLDLDAQLNDPHL